MIPIADRRATCACPGLAVLPHQHRPPMVVSNRATPDRRSTSRRLVATPSLTAGAVFCRIVVSWRLGLEKVAVSKSGGTQIHQGALSVTGMSCAAWPG